MSGHAGHRELERHLREAVHHAQDCDTFLEAAGSRRGTGLPPASPREHAVRTNAAVGVLVGLVRMAPARGLLRLAHRLPHVGDDALAVGVEARRIEPGVPVSSTGQLAEQRLVEEVLVLRPRRRVGRRPCGASAGSTPSSAGRARRTAPASSASAASRARASSPRLVSCVAVATIVSGQRRRRSAFAA